MNCTQGSSKVSFLKSQGADFVIDLDHTSKERPLNAMVKQHAPAGGHPCWCPCGV